MARMISVQGPVERIGDQLMLVIPLAVGGRELAPCARGIGIVDDEFLRVTIPVWLAEKLKIADGSMVSVDNRDGKFNIHTMPPRD